MHLSASFCATFVALVLLADHKYVAVNWQTFAEPIWLPFGLHGVCAVQRDTTPGQYTGGAKLSLTRAAVGPTPCDVAATFAADVYMFQAATGLCLLDGKCFSCH